MHHARLQHFTRLLHGLLCCMLRSNCKCLALSAQEKSQTGRKHAPDAGLVDVGGEQQRVLLVPREAADLVGRAGDLRGRRVQALQVVQPQQLLVA